MGCAKMIRKTSISILFVVLAGCAWGEPQLGAVAYHQALLDVGTDLRLMCVAAHPDDEDSGTLTLYRKKFGAHTIAVIATRGEGGQNEIGPELYEELGVIRTGEMMGASEVTGADLQFLSLPEFGYSKSRDETFKVWGEAEALRRMVRMIRRTKPDVIITHHGPTGGHGHHQAIGYTLQKAFDVAGDPSVFPEQIREGLEPWQPARLYLRSRSAGAVEIDMTQLDPVRGLTYGEISAQAVSKHLSQGFDKFVKSGFFGGRTPMYSLLKSSEGGVMNGGSVAAPDGGLFRGLMDRVVEEDREISQSGKSRGEILDEALALAAKTYGERDGSPQAWRRWERANRLAAVAAEVRLAARIDDDEVVPGQKARVTAVLTNFGGRGEEATLWVEAPGWEGPLDSARRKVNLGSESKLELEISIPSGAPVTLPHAEHVFEDGFLRPQLAVVAAVKCGPATIELRAPLVVDVAPLVSAAFVNTAYLVRKGVDGEVTFKLDLTNHGTAAADVWATLTPDGGLSLSLNNIEVALRAEGEERIVPLKVSLRKDLAPGDYALTARLKGSGESAVAVARVVDLRIPPNVRVGVIQSYDDTFMKTLERFNVPHVALTKESFTPEILDGFTTVIVDIRAYLVRPDLVANNEAVLEYVKRGGNLIVMYHKTFEWKSEFAPYPIRVSRNRVTVEDAPMTILEKDHPLFNIPNKIGPSDWSGWIQERGLYFPSTWDEAYTPLIGVVDPGENIPPGSCLVASYGEGTYMYTALGWYRQLRELHPGALRVFANMLAF